MKSRMQRYWRAVRARPFVSVGLVVVVGLIAWWGFFADDKAPVKTITVTRGEFVQQVSVSGKVVAEQEAKLAFSETGRVEALNVKVGDKVPAGKTLATLAVSVLLSDLRTAKSDLDKIQQEQNALVANAYRTLLSDNLAAVPSSSLETATPPTITGLYNGAEGTYRVRVTKKVNSSDYEIQVFNLEELGRVDVLEDEPTPLGTRGLYISFPDGQAAYDDSIWYIAIPNVKSSSYLANYNAYQEALRAREKAVAAAEAEIDRIQTEIAERTLRAPFSGVVTVVDTEVGSTAAVNDPIITLIGADTLQIESFVPEINLAFVQPGASSTVTLDAYGESVPFEASVVSIDPAETVRDGVSTYRAILTFAQKDERIRSGMTANVVIIADRRQDVLTVPQGAITTRNGKHYVQVQQGETSVEREVYIGSVSSLGSTEILSGLTEGEILVLPN